jgi:hypothetical protein
MLSVDVLGTTILAGAVAIVVSFASEPLKARLQRETNRLQDQRAERAVHDLEELKSRFSILQEEHRTRFSALFVRRADVAAVLHQDLLEAQDSWSALLSPGRAEAGPSEEELEQCAYAAMYRWRKAYYESRIYFSRQTCAKMDALDGEFDRVNNAFRLHKRLASSESAAAAWEAFAHLNTQMNQMRLEIEDEFRTLLGVVDAAADVPSAVSRNLTNPAPIPRVPPSFTRSTNSR